MEELLECKEVGKLCQKLLDCWSTYGHGVEQLEKRKRTVNKHVNELLSDMIREEDKRIIEKKAEVDKINQEILQLKTQLDVQEAEKSGDNFLSTLEILQKHKAELFALKEEKMKDWMDAKKQEELLCAELDEIPMTDILDHIPKNIEVGALKQRIQELIEEKKNRIHRFHELSEMVTKFLDLMEKDAAADTDRVLTDKQLTLNTTFLETAENRRNELINEYAALQSQWAPMVEEIQALWIRLEIPEADRIDFGDEPRPSVFENVKVEHSRLLALKRANLSNFITKLRIELETISKETFRTIIMPPEADTDESLEEHEQLLKVMQDYKSQNQTILDLINKRKEVFSQWKECEMKADDPSRFNNRGGGLLKEEKLRKTLQKQLPKMDKDLEKSDFKIWGLGLQEWLQQGWDEWNQLKEDLKKKRKEEAAAGGINDMNTTRKRPATPLMGQAKITRGTPLTPRKNPIVLDPATTYTDFQNHNIFQSTMNKGDPKSPGRPTPAGAKSPSKGPAYKLTTPRNPKFNENF